MTTLDQIKRRWDEGIYYVDEEIYDDIDWLIAHLEQAERESEMHKAKADYWNQKWLEAVQGTSNGFPKASTR